MKVVYLYFEGGGPEKARNFPLRRAMTAFLRPIITKLEARNVTVRPIASGGRSEAFADFQNGRATHPDATHILLVDAEARIAEDGSRCRHLAQRDKWNMNGVAEEHVYFMASCMEAWLMADRENIKARFGKDADLSVIPENSDLGAIKPEDCKRKLTRAKNKPKHSYNEIDDGARLLESTDLERVRSRCRHARAFFEYLESLGR